MSSGEREVEDELPPGLTPRQITEEYWHDYKLWNDYAVKKRDADASDRQQIGNIYYSLIICKYATEDKKFQGLAYGSDSIHCPEQERVVAETIDGDKATVETLFTKRDVDFIKHRYHYEYTKVDDRWVLDEVYLVDDDGRYPGL